MEYVNRLIEKLEHEITLKNEYLNELKNIGTNRSTILKVRLEIHKEYRLKRKTSMGRGTARMREYNDKLLISYGEQLQEFDDKFAICEDEIRSFDYN